MSMRCKGCGNQSKRECEYSRCRTCCNTQGFPCNTHVSSTWVQANSTRRRRRLSPSTAAPPTPKRSRRDSESSTGNVNLPAEVNIPAVFRCVRVSSVDNVVDQLAYQMSVNIAGHVFKGVLYDQGVPSSGETVYGGGDGGGFQNLSLATSSSNPFGGSVPVAELFQYLKP